MKIASYLPSFIIVLILSILTCFSCTQKKQPSPVPGTAEIAPIDNLNIQVSSFSEIDTSGILMFPLSMGESKRYGGSLSYKEMPNYTHWNIIFFNSKTDEYHLLSDKKMLIRSYDLKYHDNGEMRSLQSYRHIFYRIVTHDINKDKLLTESDPDYLFVSDKEGGNFRQLSPDLYTLINWEFIQSSNKVIMFVRKDSDGNNKFDEDDEITTFEIDIDKELPAKQVFSAEFKTQLKALYDRDWKRIKK